MKRVSVSDLRYRFSKIERLLKSGEEIEITKRNKPIARLLPAQKTVLEMPDFRGRMKKIFGDRILEPSNAELIAEDRDRF